MLMESRKFEFGRFAPDRASYRRDFDGSVEVRLRRLAIDFISRVDNIRVEPVVEVKALNFYGFVPETSS